MGSFVAEGSSQSATIESLRAALADAEEADRYRLLATLFSELAATGTARSVGAEDGDARLTALSNKLQKLGEERAGLQDELATTRADLEHHRRQLEAEQVRAEDQKRVLDEQRTRLEALRKERAELEAEATAKNSALYEAEKKCEELEIQLQRSEVRGADRSQTDRLEAGRRELTVEVDRLKAAMDQLRLDKDAEIERLKGELVAAGSASGVGAEKVLANLWQRLAHCKPALVEGHVPPTVQAAERMVDAFIELAQFSDESDKGLRVFLDKYTKYHPSVKVPWQVYAKRDGVHETVKQTLAVHGGRPVGLLKMRLRFLYAWTQAAMIGADSAVESIASELEAHLRGPVGMEADANRKIKDYIRDDGHYRFMERIRELRSQKLAETYGRAG